MRIEALRKRKRGCSITGLPEPLRTQAVILWHYFCDREWESRRTLPSWRRAMYAGIAKRLVLYPFDSAQGRSLHAARGGHARWRKHSRQTRDDIE